MRYYEEYNDTEFSQIPKPSIQNYGQHTGTLSWHLQTILEELRNIGPSRGPVYHLVSSLIGRLISLLISLPAPDGPQMATT